MLKIAFWSKDTGNLLSHSKGLTAEHIQALKELKEGDRLILWLNKREKDSDSSYTLKVFHSKVHESLVIGSIVKQEEVHESNS